MQASDHNDGGRTMTEARREKTPNEDDLDLDDDGRRTFADTKAQQDRFAEHLRESDDFEEAVEKDVRGDEPEHEPEGADPMP
jgi:hypothetical protein